MKNLFFQDLILTIGAVIFKDSIDDLFLGISEGQIVMTANVQQALDISVENAIPAGIGSILSLGTTALFVDKKEKNKKRQVKRTEINSNDPSQQFKLVLINENVKCREKRCFDSIGSIVIQQEGKCLGYSALSLENDKKELKQKLAFEIQLNECTDARNLITFAISERLDASGKHDKNGLLKNKIISELPSNDELIYIGFLRKENGFVGHLY